MNCNLRNAILGLTLETQNQFLQLKDFLVEFQAQSQSFIMVNTVCFVSVYVCIIGSIKVKNRLKIV